LEDIQSDGPLVPAVMCDCDCDLFAVNNHQAL